MLTRSLAVLLTGCGVLLGVEADPRPLSEQVASLGVAKQVNETAADMAHAIRRELELARESGALPVSRTYIEGMERSILELPDRFMIEAAYQRRRAREILPAMGISPMAVDSSIERIDLMLGAGFEELLRPDLLLRGFESYRLNPEPLTPAQ